jgi:argininosuccinate lyase
MSTQASSLARTAATGHGGMIPELLAWSTSYTDDLRFLREDLLGSAAHATMLGRTGIIAGADARALREALLGMFHAASRDELSLPDGEEDVHMAIEVELTKRLGDTGKRVNTARSRNDQVATALRLFVRGQLKAVLAEASLLVAELAERAAQEADVLLPAYTHRQRAQPVSAAFVMSAWSQPIVRAAELAQFSLGSVSLCPLGSGACSGSSLPIDRHMTSRLLGFAGPSKTALDTVGDRDFELDFSWACARILLALSRMATDVVDFTTQEFRLLRIGDAVSAGSSMMPQKKNPDIFELVRGKSALGLANVVHLFTLVKGLPGGYNRDLQDDRRAALQSGDTVLGAMRAVRLATPHLSFDRAECLRALSDGSTQATDLAEALVKKGMPFREAYRAVGALVRRARDEGKTLAQLDLAAAQAAHPEFDAECIKRLDPATAAGAKQSTGGTAPGPVAEQLAELSASAKRLAQAAHAVPDLQHIAETIAQEPL